MDLLIVHPMIGPESDEPGVRIRLVTPYPYRVYYRIKPDAVEILHVRHTARREPDPSEVI